MGMGAAGWPVSLEDGRVTARPLRLRDGPAWVAVRRRNVDWLIEWEATPPDADEAGGAVPSGSATFVTMTRRLRAQARQGRGLPFVVLYDGEFAGQLNVGGVGRGALHSAHLRYWLDREVARGGGVPAAGGLGADHCLGPGELQRVGGDI